MEAQTQRTPVRLLEPEMEAKNATLAGSFQGEQPDAPPPAYPGTVARQNVTVRRSRDRLSAASNVAPKTPDDLTTRRPNRRARDVRYSIESDGGFLGATAVTYRKQHGREFQESHLRDRGAPNEMTHRVAQGSSPNQMAGSVIFSNPNPVESITNPNQKFRPNS
jgi:hypothetical protein